MNFSEIIFYFIMGLTAEGSEFWSQARLLSSPGFPDRYPLASHSLPTSPEMKNTQIYISKVLRLHGTLPN
jgi:hypothetical protein